MNRARSLNALTILADYSNDLQDIHRTLGNEGMASYYHDLQEWFNERMQIESEVSLDTDTIPERESNELMRPVVSGIHYVQAFALVVLAGLIATLLIENMRLRKKSRNL
jgi:hypothetical protein